MLDYLSQLALRVQQPGFTVQPRPVSRFESPRPAIFVAPEPPAPAEADETESSAVVWRPTETGVGQPPPQTDSRNHHESEPVESLSAARPTQVSHQPSPRRSTTVPPIVPQASSPAVAQQPLYEVAYPALRRSPATQSAELVRSPETQAQPSVRIDQLGEQVGMTSSETNPRRRELGEMDRAAVRAAREPIRPLVRIENPQGPWVSPLSTRDPLDGAVESDRESPEVEPLSGRAANLMPQFDLTLRPERDMLQLFTEPAPLHLGAERVADTPTIQVTIGRVEIRATVESTPTRKTPAKAPVMSLDEYLRQRNGGRG